MQQDYSSRYSARSSNGISNGTCGIFKWLRFGLKDCIVSIASHAFLILYLASSFPTNCLFSSLLHFFNKALLALALVAYSITPHILFNLSPEVQLAATA